MSTIAVRQLLRTLREGIEGTDEGPTYFLDSRASLRQTLSELSAEEASRDVGGNSVAAHAYHIVFAFEAFGAYVRGDRTRRDWNESWRVSTVDPAQWEALQKDVFRGYEELRDAIKNHAEESDDTMGGTVGAVAHLAYHIGAIRQKLAVARTR